MSDVYPQKVWMLTLLSKATIDHCLYLVVSISVIKPMVIQVLSVLKVFLFADVHAVIADARAFAVKLHSS